MPHQPVTDVATLLRDFDEQLASLVAFRDRLAAVLGRDDPSPLPAADPTVGWIRQEQFDRSDVEYPWPDGSRDHIPTLQVWRAPESVGGGLFALGEASDTPPTFGRPRRYTGVFILGGEGGSQRHVANFSEDDEGGRVALIRGKGASQRGYFDVDEPLPAGYEYLPTASHTERVHKGWTKACVVAAPDGHVLMLAHAALQARLRGLRPMGA